MLDNLTSRGTFYDISGYLIPGLVFVGELWMTWYAFSDGSCALSFAMSLWQNGGFLTAICCIFVGYLFGHFVNSVSSAVLEKWLFADKFRQMSNWQARAEASGGDRLKKLGERSDKVFGLDIKQLQVFDLLTHAAEYLPRAFVSGFSFLSFYGMCRSLSMLSVLVIPAVFTIAYSSCGCTCEYAWSYKSAYGLLWCLLPMISAIAFFNQYMRFVKYYADFLGSTLLCKGNNEKVS